MVGGKNEIDKFVKGMKTQFKIREYNDLDEFVGCEMMWNDDNTQVIFHQTKIASKLSESLKYELEGVQKYATPAIPGKGLDRSLEREQQMNIEKQKNYRSCVGTLLYLTKFS